MPSQYANMSLNGLILQPWSVPIVKTSLPPEILQTMIEISDQIIADKEAEPAGPTLAGQIENELKIDKIILKQTGIMNFFQEAVRQFVIICKCQMLPDIPEVVQQEEWLTELGAIWIVSQQPGEYNPLHKHNGCHISTVMYLKVPKMLPSRKEYKGMADGSIVFTSNCARDSALCVPHITVPPQVGDFYLFGAQQQHAVYPYRCAEGQEDVERRSISFNATFQDKPNLTGADLRFGEYRA